MYAAAESRSLIRCNLIIDIMPFTYERLDKSKAALLVVDHQEGLYQLVRDASPGDFKSSILAHAAIAKVFNLPVVMTTSAETGRLNRPSDGSSVLTGQSVGPNGPLPAEILAMHPNAPLIKRQGEVDAWDNSDFRAAVEATGKKQLIIAGITTDVSPAPTGIRCITGHSPMHDAPGVTTGLHGVPRALPRRGRVHRVRERRRVGHVRRQDRAGREGPHARRRRARAVHVRGRLRADARLAQHPRDAGADALLRPVSSLLYFDVHGRAEMGRGGTCPSMDSLRVPTMRRRRTERLRVCEIERCGVEQIVLYVVCVS